MRWTRRFGWLIVSAATVAGCGGSSEPSGSTGDVQVTVNVSGSPVDPDGYNLTLGASNIGSVPGAGGSTTLTSLSAGQLYLRLTGLAANCEVTGVNPASVDVVAGTPAQITFDVSCGTRLAGAMVAVVRSGTADSIRVIGSDGSVGASIAAGTSPAVSPNGIRIAMIDTGGVTVMNADGSGRHVVIPKTYQPTPSLAWGADGTLLVRASGPGGLGLYQFNSDGSGFQKLAASAATASNPAISYDGRLIAADVGDKIATLAADGTGLRYLKSGSWTSWSPDGALIAYTDSLGSVAAVTPTNTNAHHIGGAPVGPIAWSRDGVWIAYPAVSGQGTEIHLIHPDGTSEHALTSYGQELIEPAWGPAQ